MTENEYIGGAFFKKLQTDARVTPDLAHCLYCKVVTDRAGDVQSANHQTRPLDYKIPLNCINGNQFKQCPACGRIYILSDPI